MKLSKLTQPPLLAITLSVTLLIQGCGPTFVRPTIYPNEHLRQVGHEQFERDLTECNGLATTYVTDKDRYDEIARDSLTGAAVGSASGAVAGVVLGESVGRAVGAGAAVGAIVPLLHNIFRADEPSPDRERFVAYRAI